MIGSTTNRRVLSTVLLIFITTGASRADQVDQEFFGTVQGASVSVSSDFDRAQTFTVGITGFLTRIELPLGKSLDTPDASELQIDIRPSDQFGVPLEDDSSVLATAVVLGSEVDTVAGVNILYEIVFDPGAPAVSQGDILAIVLTSDVSRVVPVESFRWVGDAAGGYAGGDHFNRSASWNSQGDFDAAFRTYVPEPSGAATAGAALAALVALAGRRRAQRLFAAA